MKLAMRRPVDAGGHHRGGDWNAPNDPMMPKAQASHGEVCFRDHQWHTEGRKRGGVSLNSILERYFLLLSLLDWTWICSSLFISFHLPFWALVQEPTSASASPTSPLRPPSPASPTSPTTPRSPSRVKCSPELPVISVEVWM